MKPSDKSEKMAEALDSLSNILFGRTRSKSIKEDVCVFCGKSATDFTDERSKTEYGISGMCQECQDDFFEK